MPLKDFLEFSKDGLIPAVVVSDDDGQVLTLCYMNEEALAKTLATGKVHVFRRSKGRLMMKGETSGHVQIVREIRPDCAGRSLLIRVTQKVAGCHEGYMSCYYRVYDAEPDKLRVVEPRVFDPKTVYETVARK